MNNELKHYGVPGMKWGVRRGKSIAPIGTKKRPKGGWLEPESDRHRKWVEDNGIAGKKPKQPTSGVDVGKKVANKLKNLRNKTVDDLRKDQAQKRRKENVEQIINSIFVPHK